MFVDIPAAEINRSDCHFYHTLDFPDGETVQGDWDLRGRLDDYLGGVNLAGKSFLDIGTASGFLTFAAEKQGANVVSFDMDTPARQHLLPFAGHVYFRDWAKWVEKRRPGLERWHNAYYVSHHKTNSQARLFHGNIYTLPHDLEERFDVVLLGSILEHLSNPLLAMQAAAQMTTDTLIITERLIHDSKQPVAIFMGRENVPEKNNYVWWKLSLGLYREYLGIMGFRIDSTTNHDYLFRGLTGDKYEPVNVTTMVCRRGPKA